MQIFQFLRHYVKHMVNKVKMDSLTVAENQQRNYLAKHKKHCPDTKKYASADYATTKISPLIAAPKKNSASMKQLITRASNSRI